MAICESYKLHQTIEKLENENRVLLEKLSEEVYRYTRLREKHSELCDELMAKTAALKAIHREMLSASRKEELVKALKAILTDFNI